MKQKIIITTGDNDGIGVEVTCKALIDLGPQKGFQLIVFKSQNNQDSWLIKVKKSKKWKHSQIANYASFNEAIEDSGAELIFIQAKSNEVEWIEQAAHLCFTKKASGMVTGPLSKQLIKSYGRTEIGHTQILKRICQAKQDVFMAFLGPKLNVALLTGHIPVKEVESQITYKNLKQLFIHVSELKGALSKSLQKKPIGILGLNPHAGDDGIIGTFENRHLKNWISKLGSQAVGPLIPDVAFDSVSIKRYSFFIALYHDQGLIPFKSLHGFDYGVHMTLGLPIIRTSVDHGTAKDIFNKNKAKSGSMKAAIEWAIKLARN